MITKIDNLSIATIRSLCIDITNKAKSGHPGMAIGSAPILYTLFTKHLNVNPKNSKWFNRDRFVLSAGHASSLLYSLLHLSGFDVSMDDLKSFRQLNSKAPGHPEVNVVDGVDATSGPLGQGIAQAVGMAMAETMVSSSYVDGGSLCNHYTYALCGDGCLQEGLSQEAISLAGHLQLNKLILFYDCNNVTLDGDISLSFSENVKARFEASGWNAFEINDGNNIQAIDNAINNAKKSKDKPTIIIVHTIIGQGSSKQGTNKCHGSPLGIEDGKVAKLSYDFEHEDFYVPAEVYEHFASTIGKRGKKLQDEYDSALRNYKKLHPVDFEKFMNCTSSLDVSKYLPDDLEGFEEKVSTRVVSGQVLNYFNKNIPNLFGGSADVSSSVMTKLDDLNYYSPSNRSGHSINFGIREFAMASAQNGMLLHGGIRTYAGSFFVFTDYFKAAIRMSALCKIPAIYLLSHDSIAVGEDGPTHEPIEQLATLRSIPGVDVIRPADSNETYAAWKSAMLSLDRPTCLILSRQGLPTLKKSNKEAVCKGAYTISQEANKAELIILATGSEVSLAIEAQEKLLNEGIDVRVVSMPCWSYFDKQSEEYKKTVLCLPREKIISLEMSSSFGWDKYASNHISVDEYGVSAPANDAIAYFGFDLDSVINKIKTFR